jgi:hypothetical protein
VAARAAQGVPPKVRQQRNQPLKLETVRQHPPQIPFTDSYTGVARGQPVLGHGRASLAEKGHSLRCPASAASLGRRSKVSPRSSVAHDSLPFPPSRRRAIPLAVYGRRYDTRSTRRENSMLNQNIHVRQKCILINLITTPTTPLPCASPPPALHSEELELTNSPALLSVKQLTPVLRPAQCGSPVPIVAVFFVQCPSCPHQLSVARLCEHEDGLKVVARSLQGS